MLVYPACEVPCTRGRSGKRTARPSWGLLKNGGSPVRAAGNALAALRTEIEGGNARRREKCPLAEADELGCLQEVVA